jgi:hypothetical protein
VRAASGTGKARVHDQKSGAPLISRCFSRCSARERRDAPLFVEYKPKTHLDSRAELSNIGNAWAPDLSLYCGVKTSAALAYASHRDMRLGPVLLLRMRKKI